MTDGQTRVEVFAGKAARAGYRIEEVLGDSIYREYGATSCVQKFLGSWLLLVTGSEPMEDKPGVTLAPPFDLNFVSHAMTIRVPDCEAAYGVLKSRGAGFLTPTVDQGAEIRCFFRDPYGYLLEISQSR